MKQIKNKLSKNNPVAKFAGLFNRASVVESKKQYSRNVKHRRSSSELHLSIEAIKNTLNSYENTI